MATSGMANTGKKNPPQEATQALQYDLFAQFVSNNKDSVSNSLEMWDRVPKYFFTRDQTQKHRNEHGQAAPFTWQYTISGATYTVRIQPAMIEQKDGSYRACFPGTTEELVEEALKKIFSEQNYGMHDANRQESWVRFTLQMVRRELAARGRTRSIQEIKHAIEVMSSCILTIRAEQDEEWRGAILQDLVTVGREDYVADTKSHHIARLPIIISRAINMLDYRQFNYHRLMQCDLQLSRWIYKLLILRYRQASMLNDYHFMFSTLTNSGLLQQGTGRNNRRKVMAALNELQRTGVLRQFTVDERRDRNKIIDVKYTVAPTGEFVKEQKAANKRAHDNQIAIKKTKPEHLRHQGKADSSLF